MGILYKVLTLQQVIIFFRGLGNNILNIVDPSCFVLRKKDSLLEVPVTPQLPDSQQGTQGEVHAHNPWDEKLAELAAVDAAAAKRRNTGGGGGTKRKKSMRSYSRKRRTRRKHRTHRKRRATRRYRRIRN